MINWKKLNQDIVNSKRIVLSTHMSPDGDGLGSASAMHHYISSLGLECRIIQISKFPDQYNFLNKASKSFMARASIHSSLSLVAI